jgi:hypothetical protein
MSKCSDVLDIGSLRVKIGDDDSFIGSGVVGVLVVDVGVGLDGRVAP